MEHYFLALLIVVVAVIGWIMLARLSHYSRDSLEALMHGQEHIAELVAEVLPRTPER